MDDINDIIEVFEHINESIVREINQSRHASKEEIYDKVQSSMFNDTVISLLNDLNVMYDFDTLNMTIRDRNLLFVQQASIDLEDPMVCIYDLNNNEILDEFDLGRVLTRAEFDEFIEEYKRRKFK